MFYFILFFFIVQNIININFFRGFVGLEVEDEEFNFVYICCCFNSSSVFSYFEYFKFKFEINEFEFVFEEDIYGVMEEEEEKDSSQFSILSSKFEDM